MKITRKSDYGLRAVCELAKHYEQSPVSITDIASAQGIPDPFLEKIMQELKAAGLIRATHGRGGGYSLKNAPEKISTKEVIEALEGPVALVHCLDPSLQCMIEEGCPTSDFWSVINLKFQQALGETSLADLIPNGVKTESEHLKILKESGVPRELPTR
jgi:Rrf2 family protein